MTTVSPLSSMFITSSLLASSKDARFGRTLSEVMTLLSKCMTLGVHVYSINDRYLLDDSLNTEVVSTTCNLVSEIEHHLMSVRTKEALNHKKEKEGLQLGRPKGTDAKQSYFQQ